MTDQKLSPHFSLSEFVKPGVKVSPQVVLNLTELCIQLEKVRIAIGNKPMQITSGYRTPTHNKAVDGAKNSFHLKGMAADFVVEGMTADEVRAKVMNWWPGGIELGVSWTHLDLGPKRRFYP
jgi:uncharacterized protein YcbK (DUF882 family)